MEEPAENPRMLTYSKQKERGGTIDATDNQHNKRLMKLASESPLIGGGSEIRRSYKDVASYLTPNKSSSKSMNQTS
jgi:hypothetical protein